MIVHVDDLLFFGDLRLANLLYEELAPQLLLKKVRELTKTGDSAIYVGKTLTMRDHGYSWSGSEKLVNALFDELRLQNSKSVATPAVRYAVKMEVEAEELVSA